MRLELDRVTHTYPGSRAPAIVEVSAVVPPGITGLIGINGAGKSTLLNILSRGMPPSAGATVLDGTDIYRGGRRATTGRIALMPQDFRVAGEARVEDVLLYCAWLKGVPGALARERAADVLERVDLGPQRFEKIGRLSGGMRRRVALAQALISCPRLVLLDEPTTGLDPAQRAQLRRLVIDEFSGTDAIVILSSHLMEDVEATSDNVILLHEGVLRFAGSIEEFRRVDGEVVDAEAAFLRRIMTAAP
ncbi:ATP-binding cassette domain-containing protein [Nocardioides sp. BP30]|uniref:ATP-binding cassette domain-containing protein n=1 Tax=Nocardioides sp. BP30 TaxID=3036374 RepID=UPI0024699870|nr:ATP-binding cassette domain-containing protein [Nocardioides sp. BP30]WGL50442.1 ATP-binding cassette domain-containing protein [Nocardioides sp. BP30]